MKEATKHEASLIRDGVMDDDSCLVVSAADYDALRQQLADVSNERDLLRAERDQLVTCGIELERGLRIIATANVKTRAPDLRLKAKQTLNRAMSGASTEQQAQS